ncbi:collagen alpha-1(I) chain-like [Mustela nigripes]|uniref:collagen alpha-1(I) chain-like n=1 Tax=Mustela nigripes TaxID=77151 RepID=UPI002815C80B|nr:collagen alpha-1(I) chain-like [Mustela nigripes]
MASKVSEHLLLAKHHSSDLGHSGQFGRAMDHSARGKVPAETQPAAAGRPGRCEERASALQRQDEGVRANWELRASQEQKSGREETLLRRQPVNRKHAAPDTISHQENAMKPQGDGTRHPYGDGRPRRDRTSAGRARAVGPRSGGCGAPEHPGPKPRGARWPLQRAGRRPRTGHLAPARRPRDPPDPSRPRAPRAPPAAVHVEAGGLGLPRSPAAAAPPLRSAPRAEAPRGPVEEAQAAPPPSPAPGDAQRAPPGCPRTALPGRGRRPPTASHAGARAPALPHSQGRVPADPDPRAPGLAAREGPARRAALTRLPGFRPEQAPRGPRPPPPPPPARPSRARRGRGGAGGTPAGPAAPARRHKARRAARGGWREGGRRAHRRRGGRAGLHKATAPPFGRPRPRPAPAAAESPTIMLRSSPPPPPPPPPPPRPALPLRARPRRRAVSFPPPPPPGPRPAGRAGGGRSPPPGLRAASPPPGPLRGLPGGSPAGPASAAAPRPARGAMLTSRDPRAPARDGGKAVARLPAGGAGGRAPPALTGSRRRAAGPGPGAGSWAAAAAAAGESLRPARPRRRSHGGVCAGRPLARPGLLHLRPPPDFIVWRGRRRRGRGVRARGAGRGLRLPPGRAGAAHAHTHLPSVPSSAPDSESASAYSYIRTHAPDSGTHVKATYVRARGSREPSAQSSRRSQHRRARTCGAGGDAGPRPLRVGRAPRRRAPAELPRPGGRQGAGEQNREPAWEVSLLRSSERRRRQGPRLKHAHAGPPG